MDGQLSMKLLIRIGGRIMAEDKLFSGESKNIEYKVTVPEKSEKYMKTVSLLPMAEVEDIC